MAIQSSTEHDVLDTLRMHEAAPMLCQPSVVWTRAQNELVTDIHGNVYVDFSSGVMIANSGHGCAPIVEAIVEAAQHGVYASYSFPTLYKARLLKSLAAIIPKAYKVALFSTGAEAIEAALKVALIWNRRLRPKSDGYIVSYRNSFHGRTMGAQCIGGDDRLKAWLPSALDKRFNIQVPYPDRFNSASDSFELFPATLAAQNVSPAQVAAVVFECYQGGVGAFAPDTYLQQLASWCQEHRVLLIVDEIQSGMGRTGALWAHQHAGITPDIIVAGKGISSSLPLSAVLARAEVLDACDTGHLGTTHSGNPVCCAAAQANIEYLLAHDLPAAAARLGKVFHARLQALQARYPHHVRRVLGRGLMAALHLGDSVEDTPNPGLARELVPAAVERGLMLYNPGGPDGAMVKLVPPLTIRLEYLNQGCDILDAALAALSGGTAQC